MSRIAKNPIKISKEIECTFDNGIFSAKGKLGQIQISVNSNFNPKDSGITKISENKIAASTPKSFIGNNVTSEASFLFFIKSLNVYLSLSFWYEGNILPACLINHTGGLEVFVPLKVSKKIESIIKFFEEQFYLPLKIF